MLQQVQKQKFLLETLLANAPTGIALLRGPDFVYEFINPLYQTIVPGTRVVGKSFEEVWPEVAEEFLPVLEQVRRTGEPYRVADVPFLIRRAAEAPLEERFFNVVLARVVDDDALIAMVAETTEQVLERRRAEGLAKEVDVQSARLKQVESTLQESRANLQAALDSMADAVFITDLDGRFIEFNDALAKFYRFGSKQECARTLAEYPKFLDAYGEDGQPAPFERWAVPRALRGERATDAEYTLRRKDTGETWIGSYSFGPIRDGGGAIVGSVVVARDITEQRRAERELYNSHQEKTALLKEVHHRVKNNLQIVISLLGLQANRSRNPEVLAVFKDTQNRIRSMALLHEVLYRSGNLAQISFAVYIEDFLRHIVESYGRAAQQIKLEHRVEDIHLPLNLAVPCGLIVNELVTNAFKHAFPGGRPGKILLELARLEEEEVFLSVCDNGVGIFPEARSNTPSTLGLTLVYELSRQLSGRLTMERPDGGGTVFRIRFPVSAGTTEGAQK